MLFWVLMLLTALLCPLMMLIIGLIYKNHAPKKINRFSGYRTEMSMKNIGTWTFAHKYIARMWLIWGAILTVPSAVPMLFVMDKSEEIISIVALIVCFIGLSVMMATLIPTEIALRKNFDKDGNRR